MGSKKNLFSEFGEVSTKQWKQKIQFDLKGADYNEALVWESLEGIQVKPFYHIEDLKNMPPISLAENHRWKIGQPIYAGNPNLAYKKALNALQCGAEHLVFRVPNTTTDFAELLQNIDTAATPIHFWFDFLDSETLRYLVGLLGNNNKGIYLNIDILGNLAKSGNWFYDKAKDHQILEAIVQLGGSKPNLSFFGVDTTLYQNAGANIVQQLAYGLAHVNEYLNHYNHVIANCQTERGRSQNEKSITFKVAIGSNYFLEVAKLKALRWLWKTLAAAYEIGTHLHILAVPTKRNKTLYDYNVNMLRTNTECMAAVLGGADTICNLAYDWIYHRDNEFGERIARNQLLLLKKESHFNDAVHATEGSYYIETLTKQLAEKALALFKQLENSGGLLKHLQNGTIQRKIRESAQKEQALFDAGDIVSIGTNTYQNPQDKMKDDLQLYPFMKTDKRKTIIEPIIEKRLSEPTEIKRLREEENHG